MGCIFAFICKDTTQSQNTKKGLLIQMHYCSLKKLLLIITALIILTSTLSGCDFPRQNSDWQEKIEEYLHNNCNSDETSNIIDYEEELCGNKIKGYEGVFDISSVTEGYDSVELKSIIENKLLLTLFNKEKTAVCLYDMLAGSKNILWEADIEEHNIAVYPDGSAIVYNITEDEKKKEIFFYRNLLEETEPYRIDSSLYNNEISSFCRELVFIKDEKVYSFNTQTKTENELFQLTYKNKYNNFKISENYLYVNGYDYDEKNESKIREHFYIYNNETQKSGILKDENNLLLMHGENISLFYTRNPKDKDTLFITDSDNLAAGSILILKSNYETPVWAGGDCFVTNQIFQENIIRVYDTKEQVCVSEFRFSSKEEAVFSDTVLSQDKRLGAVLGYDNDTIKLYLIILDDREPPKGKYYFEYDEEDYETLTEQGKRAYDIGKKYGVIIHLYKNAIAEDCDPYFPEVLADNKKIDYGLDCLENVLSKFPKGFFKELCSGEYSVIEFNITGKINSDSEETIDAVGFYFTNSDNRHIIVADCSEPYELEYTFAHEIMHAMDAYIYTKANSAENYGYENWYNYLPSGFEYNEDYLNEDGEMYEDTKYVYIGRSKRNIYFISPYQKTYDIEDRAVMFEYLFVNGKGFKDTETSEYYLSLNLENVNGRAVYMCSVIRKYFKTADAVKQTQWEKPLGVTSYNISIFLEQANAA